MVKQLSIVLLLSFFFFSTKVSGKGILLTPTGNSNVVTKPGEISSFLYKIKNESDTPLIVSKELILPEKWQVVTGTLPEKLQPGIIKNELVSFRIPDYTLAGKYNLTLKILTADSSYSANLAFTVEVQEVVKLSVSILSSANHVVAGNQTTARYLVNNDGNSIQNVTLEPTGCVVKGPTSFQLGPGASRVIEVTTDISNEITQVTNRSFRLGARVSGKSNVYADAVHSYRIIPVKEVENDLYFRFPVEASLRYLMRNNRGQFYSGFQGQIYGDGFLDVNNTKRLTFLARGPNQFDASALGTYDQYFVSYKQNEFMLFAGDKSYSLSPLTEMARYGRGAQAEGYYGNFMVGGFYHQPRFYPYLKDETAVYSKFKFYKKNSVGVSYLRKRYHEISDDSHLFSLNFDLQPFKNSLLEIEVSKGMTGKKSGYGVYTNFVANWKKVNISALVIYTGKNYPGYYINSLFYTFMGNWRITRKLSVNAGIRQDYQNATQDTLFGAAPYSQGYYAGTAYRFSKDIDFRIYYDYRVRMDRAKIKKFYYKEHVVRAYFTHQIKNFSYSLNGEIGKTENLLLQQGNRLSDSYMATVDAYYSVRHWVQLGGFVSFTSNNKYSAETVNSWYYGASVSGTIIRNLRYNIWYQSDYELEDYYRTRSLFNASVDWRITKNHSINLMANYALQQKQVDATDYSAAITYTWHFGVPLKKTAEAGSVSGKVINVSATNVEGIIMHLNGHTVITDENGNFSIKNLKPGTYYLLIDRSTIGIHELPDVPIPIKVEVKAGNETFVTFGLTTAAKVKGSLSVKTTSKSSSKLWGDEKIPNHIILELTNGDETMKIISEEDGSFQFPDVRPGKWILKAYTNGLTGKYSIEKDEFNLDLKPGKTYNVKVVLIKKQKRIIFMSDKLSLSEHIQSLNNK